MSDVLDLTEETAPDFEDFLYLVTDPAGSPLDRGVIIQRLLGANPVETISGTTSTIAIADMCKTHLLSNATSCAITIPANATVAVRIGESIIYRVTGAGTISSYTFTAASGVTLDGVSTGSCAASAAQKAIVLTKVGTNAWTIDGAVGAVA